MHEIARLVMLASTLKRSVALRSRDGLGSASSIWESAAACGLGRSEVDGSPGERVALAAAMHVALCVCAKNGGECNAGRQMGRSVTYPLGDPTPG